MSPRPGVLQRCLLFLLASIPAFAERLEFDLSASKVLKTTIPSLVDDSNLQDPYGYADRGERTGVFQKQVQLINSGNETLSGRLLVVNGRDWTKGANLAPQQGLSDIPDILAKQLYSFWIDHRFHGANASQLARQPVAALQFWGFTLCGEDTYALAHLFFGKDIPARAVHLNGHVAAEYQYENAWHLFDGDQNACYLGLDNQTPVSADRIRSDPFLVLRTKIFGRHSPYEFLSSAYNSSLLEFLSPIEPQPLKFKNKPAPLNQFSLNPGESLIWHSTEPPARMVGVVQENKRLLSSLCQVEYVLRATGRTAKGGKVAINTVYPIVRTLNKTTGWSEATTQQEAMFNVQVPVKGSEDEISIYCQCSRFALPAFSKGSNTLLLESEKGKARVVLDYNPTKTGKLPEVVLLKPMAVYAGSPTFMIHPIVGAEKLWWQISSERDFRFVAPNFDNVCPFTAPVALNSVSETFLSPGSSYFFRAKARSGGIWGDWCEPWEFQVKKPAQPVDLVFHRAPDGRVRLSWKGGEGGSEFLIFGSNRLDFMPEIFTPIEITALDHLKVTASRKNQNLLATVSTGYWDFNPEHRFFRVIAKAGDVLSIPSPLERLGKEFQQGLPPATVLQMRSNQIKNPDGTTGDEYLAAEEKLPPR